MAHNLTESSTFTANVNVPDDGDFVQEVSVEPGFQALANRTKYLNDRHLARPASSTDNAIVRFDGTGGTLTQNSVVLVGDAGAVTGVTTLVTSGDITAGDDLIATGDFEYATPAARVSVLPASGANGGVDQTNVFFSINYAPGGSSHGATFDLSWLPSGAIVTRVKALVDPGAARAGGNRMFMQMAHYTLNFTSPSFSGTTVDFTVYDDTTSAFQMLDSGVVALTTSNTSGQSLYTLTFYGGNDAASNPDKVYGVEIAWTDPGPRNF